MTTEDDFQNALDASPEDYQTRLVFADWLQERGDVRADGYRALGRNRFHGSNSRGGYPVRWAPDIATCWFCPARVAISAVTPGLPEDWFDAFFADSDAESARLWTRDYANRREAEDAAALGFAKLPAERRAQLLAGKGADELIAKRKKKAPKKEPKKEAKGKKKAKPKKPKGKKK